MITYPVDPASRWSLYDTDAQAIIKHNIRWPRADGGEIVGLAENLVPLMEVEEAQPAYDPATERLERATPVVDVANNTHTHGWSVVARSQEELDAAAELRAAKDAYTALKAHTGSADERATRLENVVAYMIKQMYG